MSGLKQLPSNVRADIEGFLGVTMDVIAETDRRQPNGHVSRVLDLVECLYLNQALKEKHFDSWYSTLVASHREKVEYNITLAHCVMRDI